MVHALTKYPPATGGLELHVQQLSVGLRERGLDVRVVTTDLRRHRPPVLRLTAGEDAGDGVPVVRLPVENAGTRALRIPGMAERLVAERPDVLVAWDVWSAPFAAATEAARVLDVPLVAVPTFHERHEGWLGFLHDAVSALPDRTRVLFQTPWEEKRMAELGCRFERTGWHPMAVDLAELDAAAAHPGPLPPGVPADRLLVGLVGRVTRSKGIDVLLPAFAEARRRIARDDPGLAGRLHLVVAGFTDSDERFEPQARALGIADRTTFAYDLPRREILSLLQAVRLFVLPSRAEAFGIVVLEAWASGCLVVVSDRTALPWVVEDGVTGLVSPLDELASALVRGLRLLGTPRGDRLVAEGRRRVRERHDRRRQIDDFAAVLADAVQTSEP